MFYNKTTKCGSKTKNYTFKNYYLKKTNMQMNLQKLPMKKNAIKHWQTWFKGSKR